MVASGTVSLLNGGCCCQVSLDDPASNDTIQVRIALTPAQQGLAIGAGETLIVDVSVNAPRTGAITATADMPGAAPQSFHNGWVLGNGVNAGRSFDPGETFERGALAEGNYSFQVTTRLNDRADIFTHSHASMSSSRQSSPSRFDVVAGEATHITVTTPQATLSGSYVLSGSVPNNDLASSSNVSRADAVGADTLALGGISSEFAPADGSLDLIVGPGTWRMNLLRMFLRRENDSPPLDGRMVLRFTANGAPRAENLVAGQDFVFPEFQFPTGSLTINFEALGGATFSFPRVDGTCANRDASGNIAISVDTFGQDLEVENATTAQVKLIGIDSECRLPRARAVEDGVLTTFGVVEDAVIVRGVDQEVDIGAPTLMMFAPMPNLITDAATIDVTGIATDDTGVVEVTVNGVVVALTATSNPNDENEVSFRFDDLPLVLGPNVIVTSASDASDKTVTNTRTVFRDGAPPTLTFTPVNGTVTSQAAQTVVGPADDVGVAEITIDGEAAASLSTGTGNQVAFAEPVTLADGDNFITVRVTDISGRSVAQTHQVTIADNQPPMALGQTVSLDEDTSLAITLTGSVDSAPATVDITVLAVNDAPLLAAVGDRSVAEGASLAFALAASDVDGPGLVFSASGLPAGAGLDPTSGTLSYTPGFDVSSQAADAVFDVTFTVSDGSLSASETIALTVTNVNRPSTALAGADRVLACTTAGATQVMLDAGGSRDPDGDALSFTWSGAFGTASGDVVTLSLPLGTTDVTLTVDDGLASASDEVAVTVTADVAGFLPPLSALTAVGEEPVAPNKAMKHGRVLPLKLELSCGTAVLGEDDVALPRTAALTPQGAAPVDHSAPRRRVSLVEEGTTQTVVGLIW